MFVLFQILGITYISGPKTIKAIQTCKRTIHVLALFSLFFFFNNTHYRFLSLSTMKFHTSLCQLVSYFVVGNLGEVRRKWSHSRGHLVAYSLSTVVSWREAGRFRTDKVIYEHLWLWACISQTPSGSLQTVPEFHLVSFVWKFSYSRVSWGIMTTLWSVVFILED